MVDKKVKAEDSGKFKKYQEYLKKEENFDKESRKIMDRDLRKKLNKLNNKFRKDNSDKVNYLKSIK
jgi:hypothetical protein